MFALLVGQSNPPHQPPTRCPFGLGWTKSTRQTHQHHKNILNNFLKPTSRKLARSSKDAFTPVLRVSLWVGGRPFSAASELSSFVMCPGPSFACGKYLVRWSHQSKHKMANSPASGVSDVAEVSSPRTGQTEDRAPRTKDPGQDIIVSAVK